MPAEPRFNERFDAWADDYEKAVAGRDPEYREVFAGYEDILDAVCEALELEPGSAVLEIGTGTGNLARRLAERGFAVTAVEPSTGMRRVAHRRLSADVANGRIVLVDGHFLALPATRTPGPAPAVWDGIATSFAFHHLTPEEKPEALRLMKARLRPGGRIVIADTVFADDADRLQAIREAEAAGHAHLLRDLLTEFYPTVAEMQEMCAAAGLRARIRRLNRFARLVVAA